MAERIAIVDYGAGNLRSVSNALKAVVASRAVEIEVTASAEALRTADRIILPGVGAFGACINALRAVPGMEEALREAVIDRGRPFLGVCVGMQLMASRGLEHGEHAGLGWIAGDVVRIEPHAAALKVPHMGWNRVVLNFPHPLLVEGEAYFLHSYHMQTADAAHRLAATDYGATITAAIGRDNMVGVQFHPEKSQAYGLAILDRFLDWNP